jgi:hypothetical protein
MQTKQKARRVRRIGGLNGNMLKHPVFMALFAAATKKSKEQRKR